MDSTDRLSQEDYNLLINGLDAALDYFEAIEDDQLQSVYDTYEKIYEAREELQQDQVESWRLHLERSFALES